MLGGVPRKTDTGVGLVSAVLAARKSLVRATSVRGLSRSYLVINGRRAAIFRDSRVV